jgi:tetratricopeptide (TPR) repeat protein
MRSVAWTFLFFVATALFWAAYEPLASHHAVRQLANPAADRAALHQELRRAGPGAALALRTGLSTGDPISRAYCARLLALLGHESGDRALFALLRQSGAGSVRAEAFLRSVWMERDAPPPAMRAKALRDDLATAHALVMLRRLLDRYPYWSAGRQQRARVLLRGGEAEDARRCALELLRAEPENFDAMVLLARACLTLEAPSQALTCFDRAVRLNPRLKDDLRDDIREALKALDAERARRRREQRRQAPLA